jgi:hypothetical protein
VVLYQGEYVLGDTVLGLDKIGNGIESNEFVDKQFVMLVVLPFH